MDAAAHDKRLARIDGELRRLNGTLVEMEAAAQVREARAEIEAQAFAIAANIRQVFESEPFERQREWVRTLVDKVWIDPKGNVHIDALVPGLLPVGASVMEQRHTAHGQADNKRSIVEARWGR